ncbi:MAG: GspE/PulE family protein [Candidatus Brocadiia bacterium]
MREISSVSEEEVQRAAEVAQATGKKLGEVLVNAEVITPEQKQRSLGRQWGIPFVDLRDFAFSEKVIRSVPDYLLKEHKVIPLKLAGNVLTLAITDPLNVRAIDEIRLVTGFELEPVIAVEEEVLQALDRYLGLDSHDVKDMVEDAAKEAEAIEVEAQAFSADDAEDLRISEDEPIIVRLVSLILAGGISSGASDIHVQPEEKSLRVRYRIDGVLQDAPSHSWRYGRAITARLKVMASMDIAEKRRPQDGRISFNSNGRRYDLRVSCLPGVYGEKIVMRIAEQSSDHVGLHKLGFAEDQLKRFEDVISRPYGMLLVTGPTGSGKTTTLYSVLNRLNIPEKNIITAEDPVERRIGGITQVQVGSTTRSPLTFATSLRSVLRQDPDIIMVGEIRDHDTALIATEAALTGHLVLSTLHTNDAPGAPPRLLDMGVEPFLVSSSVVACLAQRLVRVLCPKCKEPYELPPEALERLNIPVGEITGKITAYKAKGCPACNHQGYKGRLGVFELLVVTDEIRRLVLDHAPAVEIGKVACEQGMVTMLQDAVSKVLQGITSMQEALRVVDVA